MKSLNKNQYLNLIESCKNILLNKKIPLIKLYLPYLYILFEDDAHISKYQELFKSNRQEKNIINYFKLKNINIFNKFKSIIDLFFLKDGDGGYINLNNFIKKDIIIISHLTNLMKENLDYLALEKNLLSFFYLHHFHSLFSLFHYLHHHC